MTLSVHVYPDPQDEAPWLENFEVSDTATDDMLDSDADVRDHPEVPLSDERRDAVLARMGYRRTGPWAHDGERADADVTAIPFPPAPQKGRAR
ncbi:hypothetical protein ACIP5N_21380 [Streptomyces sp. NPDC088768]|uniref:hypothetical protein n=1 Tax=Streptomyces sp. NPDC088768 TaxID=3365894 RepID=UPI003814E6D3